MIKISRIIFILFLVLSCSFHNSGFWTKQENLNKEKNEFKNVLLKKKIVTQEFNKNFNFSIDKLNIKINSSSDLDNNDGYLPFNNNLEKITKYNFSKIKNYSLFDPNLIFYNENVIFFDDKGTILNFDKNSKLVWKLNDYNKEDKKSGPLITFANSKNILIAADNLAKTYAININNGKILWSKKNKTSFNSEIKIYDKKFFVVDTSNNLHSFSTQTGKKNWSFSTEKSFVNSFKKLSIVIKKDIIVFNNSLGDITALDLNDGSLLWQISTQNSEIFEEIMNLKTSELIENEGSLYFSNNKNQFFSVDITSGAINWIQNINSEVKPTIVGDLIFTVSNDGYLFVINKTNGNILRITDAINKIKSNKKDGVYPTGFILNSKNIYVSTDNGRLIVINIETGKIDKILKIDNSKVSRAFVNNQVMYFIKDNSIVKLN